MLAQGLMSYRVLLIGGAAVPFLYFGSQIAAVLLNPGYDIAGQQPSDLGCCQANMPIVANLGFIATGIAALMSGLGLFAGLRHLQANIVLAALAGLGLSLFGVAMTMSGVFPLPNPLHYGFGLTLAGILTPLFGGLAFKDGGAARWIVLFGFVVSIVLVVLSLGIGGFASDANIGIFVRAISIVAFPTIAYLCWSVMQRTSPGN
ncbi:MAG: DUF998 domain-containing protein [Terricaulis sp.]